MATGRSSGKQNQQTSEGFPTVSWPSCKNLCGLCWHWPRGTLLPDQDQDNGGNKSCFTRAKYSQRRSLFCRTVSKKHFVSGTEKKNHPSKRNKLYCDLKEFFFEFFIYLLFHDTNLFEIQMNDIVTT